jgi:pimeloyl-ACP methyl ester carboxylesterase
MLISGVKRSTRSPPTIESSRTIAGVSAVRFRRLRRIGITTLKTQLSLLTQLHASPATVVGSSAGGVIALDLTVNHPDLVSSLVLCEPSLHLRTHPDLSFQKDFLKVQLYR